MSVNQLWNLEQRIWKIEDYVAVIETELSRIDNELHVEKSLVLHIWSSELMLPSWNYILKLSNDDYNLVNESLPYVELYHEDKTLLQLVNLSDFLYSTNQLERLHRIKMCIERIQALKEDQLKQNNWFIEAIDTVAGKIVKTIAK